MSKNDYIILNEKKKKYLKKYTLHKLTFSIKEKKEKEKDSYLKLISNNIHVVVTVYANSSKSLKRKTQLFREKRMLNIQTRLI